MQRISRDQRKARVYALLMAQPDCYFTMGQIARYMGLKPSPYMRDIVMELAASGHKINRIEVTAINGKPAWGYFYSDTFKQEVLPCL